MRGKELSPTFKQTFTALQYNTWIWKSLLIEIKNFFLYEIIRIIKT